MHDFRKWAAGLTVAASAFGTANALAAPPAVVSNDAVTVKTDAGTLSCLRDGTGGAMARANGEVQSWTNKSDGTLVIGKSGEAAPLELSADGKLTMNLNADVPQLPLHVDVEPFRSILAIVGEERKLCRNVIAKYAQPI